MYLWEWARPFIKGSGLSPRPAQQTFLELIQNELLACRNFLPYLQQLATTPPPKPKLWEPVTFPRNKTSHRGPRPSYKSKLFRHKYPYYKEDLHLGNKRILQLEQLIQEFPI